MNDESSGRRAAFACVAALFVPVLSAGGVISLGSPPSAWPGIMFVALFLGLPVALLHLLVLALPAYVILREYWPLSWWTAAIGGFAVGAIPAGLLELSAGDSSSDAISLCLGGGLLGLSGGLAFWAVLGMKKGGPLPDRP